jgi:hypothetical protein
MSRASMAALVLLGMLVYPVGTLVCRMQCLVAAAQPAGASSPCEHEAGAEPTLQADTRVCDELAPAAAVKQERLEDPRPSPVEGPAAAALSPPRYSSPLGAQLASSPPPKLPFSGTDLPLRV